MTIWHPVLRHLHFVHHVALKTSLAIKLHFVESNYGQPELRWSVFLLQCGKCGKHIMRTIHILNIPNREPSSCNYIQGSPRGVIDCRLMLLPGPFLGCPPFLSPPFLLGIGPPPCVLAPYFTNYSCFPAELGKLHFLSCPQIRVRSYGRISGGPSGPGLLPHSTE